VLDRAFEHPLELEENATMPFAGGIMQHGYQCGMIWGATLAAGAEAYRRHGPGPKAEAAAINAAQRVVESFRTRHDEINCVDITGIDKSSSTWQMINYFLIKGGTIGCLRMAAWYAPLAFDEISSALSEEVIETASPPVSCAAMLARKMGESDMHAVMASGFAGGIGLCGGACGALGAAIWILGMKIGKEGSGKIGYKHPRTQEVIDRFMKHTDFTFGCTEIVGRKFKDVDDHAGYLRDGGCSELIEVLAAE
jgi:hypothetical protein